MLQLRRKDSRGHANMGWLDSHHTFSFGQYHDPKFMGFGALRVINEDRVGGGAGFPSHSHADMEILSYVLEGALQHRDSLGTGAVIRPGEIQRMTAGSGITHAEYNASAEQTVHFLQIWVIPEARGLSPSYEQKTLAVVPEGESRLDLIASRDGSADSVIIHQDVRLWRATIAAGADITFDLVPGRQAWIQMAKGGAIINGVKAEAGDGIAVVDQAQLTLTSNTSSEILIFDLA